MAFGADVQKISTQSVYVYYGKIIVIPALTGDRIFPYFFLFYTKTDKCFYYGESINRVIKILSR